MINNLRQCKKCMQYKNLDEFTTDKNSKNGHRSICKSCAKESLKQKIENEPYKYRLKVMASTILKRLKYCQYEGYEHLNCYKENNIKCELGNNVDEIESVLDMYFKEDILNLIKQGKTPSVDRIDSKENYKIGNIRILDAIENGKLGFQNANEVRKIKVKAIYPNGNTYTFNSLKEAEDFTGLHRTCISKLIKRDGVSRKDKIKFEYIK